MSKLDKSEPRAAKRRNIIIGGVIGLIWSVLLIAQGLNGSWVLIGTNSSEALVGVGILFLFGDIGLMIARLSRANGGADETLRLPGLRKKQREMQHRQFENKVEQALLSEERLPELRELHIFRVSEGAAGTAKLHKIQLNTAEVGCLAFEQPVFAQTDRVENVIRIEEEDGKKRRMTYLFKALPEGTGEIMFHASATGGKAYFGIENLSGLTPIEECHE